MSESSLSLYTRRGEISWILLLSFERSQQDTYGQQQVLWLQVAVGDVVLVAVEHGIEENLTDIAGLLFIVVTLLDDTVEKFSPHHLLGHKVVKLLFVKNIVQSNDVLVLQLGQNSNLVLQRDLIFL